jgi:hypothetical protein
MVFRLSLPLSLLAGAGVALLVGQRPQDFRLEAVWRMVDYHIALTMISIMLFKYALSGTHLLETALECLLAAGLPQGFLLVAAPAVLGFVTGDMTATVGIGFPVLMPLVPADSKALAHWGLAYVTGSVFYFMSPIHLCQVFSNTYFKTDFLPVFGKYVWSIVAALAGTVLVFLVLTKG